MLSRCGGAQHAPWHATGAGRGTTRQPNRAHRPPGRVRRADDDPVGAEAEPAGGDDPGPRHASPGTAVDPVAEPRTAVGGVVVRRRDSEPLAGGPRARRRQAVHERRRRRARARVGRDRGSREHVAAGAEHPEGEGRRIGLDHLRRGLNQLQRAAGVAMGDGVSRRGKRRRRRATAGPAAPAGRGARAPLVGHLEAQQPVARWEMPGVPTQTRRAKDAAVAQVAGDPRVPDGDRRADRMAHVGRPRTARGRRLRRRAGQNGDGRPCSGAAQRHRIPSGSAGPCASIIASTISWIASGESVADALGSSRAAWYDVLAARPRAPPARSARTRSGRCG